MPTLFDPQTRSALLNRLSALHPDTERRWGKMTPPQMVAHCNAALKMALGDLHIPPKKMIVSNRLIRYLFIHWLPTPKNLPTARELKHEPPAPLDLEAAKSEMRELLERFGRSSPDGRWPVHPAFGALDGRTWGVQQCGHIEHHFKQFGI